MAGTTSNRRFRDWLLEARMQAQLCHALYGGRDAVFDLGAVVHGDARFFEVGHVRAAVIIFSDHAHLSVCGSNALHDWVDNINARQEPFWGQKAHAGFMHATYSLRDAFSKGELWSFIDDRPVIYGGHSAGGAIANLLTFFQMPKAMFTFGAPRVFAPETAAAVAAQRWEEFRFVLPGDHVPHLPLRSFRRLFGSAKYAHASAELLLRDDGSVVMERSVWDDVKEAVLRGWLTVRGLKRAPERHSIVRYRNAILNACKQENLL